jgi:hypothetical protein
MSRYKRATKVKVSDPKEVKPALVTAAEEAQVSAAEAAAQTLMTYAQYHLGEAEKFQHAAYVLRGDMPNQTGGEVERKRQEWREAKRQARFAARGQKTAHGKPLKSGYWASMTTLERKREMAHRIAVQEGRELPRPRPKQSKVVRMPMGGVA